MDAHRKKRLEQLIAAPPYNGDRPAFIEKAGLTKGRVAQLLDPRLPFGERSARALAKALGFSDERWFDRGGLQETVRWPFLSVTPEQFYSLPDDVHRMAEAVLLQALRSGESKGDSPSSTSSRKAA